MSEPDLDLAAAELRSDAGDLRALVDGLAARLEGALPRLVAVKRRKIGGFRSKETEIQSIAVDLGDARYELVSAGAGYQCVRHSVVRGVTLKREQQPLAQWIAEVVAAVTHLAELTERDRTALEGMIR
ncbi:MAG: hypothetical protein ABSC56_00330 [Solirubrobacteraceae bacterium]|jgi:hypothetical protein